MEMWYSALVLVIANVIQLFDASDATKRRWLGRTSETQAPMHDEAIQQAAFQASSHLLERLEREQLHRAREHVLGRDIEPETRHGDVCWLILDDKRLPRRTDGI